VRSIFEAWRVSVARTRADWPIVAAAGVVTLLAAILFSAGLIYPSAAAESGLRRALDDAALGSTNIDASLYTAPERAIEMDPNVQAELRDMLAATGGGIIRDWRSSATLALGELPGAVDGDQAIVGYLDGLAEHTTLVSGSWPAARTCISCAKPRTPAEVVLLDATATDLGVRVGDVLQLVAHLSSNPSNVEVRLVGTFALTNPADPIWDQDEQLLTGKRENSQNRTFGPFLTTVEDLVLMSGVDELRLQWRTYPDFDRLRVDDAPRLRARVSNLEERLGVVAGETVQVQTGLGTLLEAAERSLLVSRTSVLLVMAQLAILAAYAIVLTATLLVDHRRIDTAMLRSRGAGPSQIALLALLEGLLLAIPAVLVAPWLAVGVLEIFNVAGPLADVGLRINPRVNTDAYIGAGVAGIVCVALLVLPAALSARRFAAAQGDVSRQETRTFGQRMGLDIALLAVTGIALWQLRLYGAPLTRTVQGSLGLDPLLVAAPAIALIAGGVLALRLLPLAAQVVERAISRGRSLVASMGSRQLARRPLRYTRSALLLMLAMSMGVFALSYGTTWATSQRDQAAYQAGADVRVITGDTGGLPAWALPGAFGSLASVEGYSPVERIDKGVSFPVGGSVDLLAIDAAKATSVTLVRGDETGSPLGSLLEPLLAGRPAPSLTSLPDGTSVLRLVPAIEIATAARFIFDPETFESESVPVDVATLSIFLSVNAVVRDANGLLYRVASGIVPYDGGDAAMVLPLEIPDPGSAGADFTGRHLDGPLELAGLGIDVFLPAEVFTSNARLGVAAAAAAIDPAGPWTDIPLAAGDGWAARLAQGRTTPMAVDGDPTGDATVELDGGDEVGTIFGADRQAPAGALSFIPTSIARFNEPIPVLANRALLDELELFVGDTLTANATGLARSHLISGVVESFPTTDPASPLLLIDEPTLAMLRLQASAPARSPDEWWLAATGEDVDALKTGLTDGSFGTTELVTVNDRARSLSTDPVALGIIGALTLGFVATGLFAVVGLTVSTAVSARQRRTEFALLRALGLSGRQLAASLWLENGSLVVVSLAAGTGLGLLIGWLVLPFVTVTQQATAPMPPVIVHVPWDRIAILDLASAVALGVSVVIIGGVLRRIGVGSVLRMGED
jgi:uncharacterized membrane protein